MANFLQEFAKHPITQWRVRSRGYFREFAPYLVASFIATAADFWSTYHFMSSDGPDGELHPVVRLLSRLLGPLAGPFIGKLGQYAGLVFLTIFCRPYARIIFIVITVIYLYAAWYNIWGWEEGYTPVFVRWFGR